MTLKIVFQEPKPHKILCLGVFEENKFTVPAQNWDNKLKGFLKESIKNSKFKGKLNQVLTLFTAEGTKIVLIGLGKNQDQSPRQWQKIGGSITTALSASGTEEAAIEIYDDKETDDELASNLAYGAILKSWRFEKYFTKKAPEELFSLKKLIICTKHCNLAEKKYKELASIVEGVFLTRSLVSEPANVINPETLAKEALTLKKDGIKVQVLEERDMRKLGMNALLGVGQGSIHESKLVIMQWQGASKSTPPLAFIGKGVTFDSGGLSLKPAANMEDMKYDMAGAATVMGVMKALALRKAKVNAVGVIGLVENMPSGSAQRPGDVVKSMSGQTIEVLNTDAEGRLLLADALWYTQSKFKPKLMVDVATLTGAMIICLGSERAGLFSSDKTLEDHLMAAGDNVDEKLWPFPLDEAFDRQIDSEIADVRNTSTGRGGGSITAAKFLQRFTNNVPWAHLDIAGVAWTGKDLPCCAKGATAFGVRLLDNFISKNYEGK